MAGPNGSGKSTILKEVRKQFYSGPFVNADEIEKLLNEKGYIDLKKEFNLETDQTAFESFIQREGASWKQKASLIKTTIRVLLQDNNLVVDNEPSPYDAALAADFIRNQLLLNEETFTFETVLSHPSKIDFLRTSLGNGFKNYLYFICTVDPAINIDRVKQRVKLGGHNVPVEKIEKRYSESLQLLSEVIPFCYRVYFFDNSTQSQSFEPKAEIDPERNLKIIAQEIPWWLQEYVIDRLYK